MSVHSVISASGIKTGDYTVTRTAASSTDGNGRMVTGSTSTFSIEASVQPYNGSVLKVLPEGIHSEDVFHVYTTTTLRTRPRPDRVSINSEVFEVFAVQGPWIAFGGSHCIAHVSRVVMP